MKVVGCIAVLLVACGERVPEAGAPAQHEATLTEVSDAGLGAPTAVVFDSLADVYLVGSAASDGSGFVSRVSPTGGVERLRWIAGDGEVGAVRALALRDDTVYVVDATCVHRFLRSSSASAGALCPPGATRLTGVAFDRRGALHITDAGDAAAPPAIYRLAGDGAVTVTGSGAEIGRPQGIAAGPWGLFVTSSEGPHVYQLHPDGNKPVLHGRDKQLRGIVATPDGSFAFTNVSDAAVVFVEARYAAQRGLVWTLLRDVPDGGQPGYDALRRRVLVPDAARGRIVFVELPPT